MLLATTVRTSSRPPSRRYALSRMRSFSIHSEIAFSGCVPWLLKNSMVHGPEPLTTEVPASDSSSDSSEAVLVSSALAPFGVYAFCRVLAFLPAAPPTTTGSLVDPSGAVHEERYCMLHALCAICHVVEHGSEAAFSWARV